MNIHWLDIVILCIIGISLAMGVWRGFIKEVLSLLAWIAAFIIARIVAPDVAYLLKPYIDIPVIVVLLSWLLPFIAVFISFHFLKLLLISVITLVGLRPIDRVFGGLFGAVRGMFIVTAIVLVGQLLISKSNTNLDTDPQTDTILVPHFQKAATWMLATFDQQSEFDINALLNSVNQSLDTQLTSIRGREQPLGESIELAQIKQELAKLGLDQAQIEQLISNQNYFQQLTNFIAQSDSLQQIKQFLKDNPCFADNC
jgi:membrane protein required for colicin V production